MNPGHDSFSGPHRMPDCTGIRERTRSVNNSTARHRSGTDLGCDVSQELSRVENSEVDEGPAEGSGRPRRSRYSHEWWSCQTRPGFKGEDQQNEWIVTDVADAGG